MIKTRTKGCVIRYLVLVIAAFLLSFGMVKISHALTEEDLDFYAQNNILFYDPGASNNLCKGASYNNQVTWTDLNPLMSDGHEATGERFKLIVETYGPFAMELQRYYGIPWEMPFVMMIFESEVGYRSSGPNAENKEVGDYNMMGLMYSSALGDDYYDDSLRAPKADQTEATSYYQSISRMLLGWTLYHVRSGHGEGYKQGLEKLDKDSYDDNLLEALELIMQSYRASNDYYKKLYDVMRGKDTGFDGLSEDEKTAIKHYADVLASVIKSKGWKNSAELAKSWDIPAGGLVVTDSFYNENGWGGWDDIRENAWNTYGLLGLPEESASRLGTNGTGCGTRLRGQCFALAAWQDGGCTGDEFTYFLQAGEWTDNGTVQVLTTWAEKTYATGNIKTDGCGPSAVAMITTALIDQLVTPDIIVDISRQVAPSFEITYGDGGSRVGDAVGIFEHYGLKAYNDNSIVRASSSEYVERINNLLMEGKMILFSVGNSKVRFYCVKDGWNRWPCGDQEQWQKDGLSCTCNGNQCECQMPLSGKGHIVAIRGIADDGNWLMFNSSAAAFNYEDFRYVPETILQAYIDHGYRGFVVVSR